MAKNQNKLTVARYAGILALGLLVAGCAKDQPPIAHGEEFHTDCDVTSVGRFNQAQAAAGAKEDGMLYENHFHGTVLNSLGQTKLDLILKGSATGDPVVIYLDVPHDEVTQREAVVTAYLKNAGVKDAQIQLHEGSNPGGTTPTAYNIAGVYKTANGGGYDGSGAESTSGGLAGAGAPAASGSGH